MVESASTYRERESTVGLVKAFVDGIKMVQKILMIAEQTVDAGKQWRIW
jgi:hypothetical protein